MNRFHKEFRTLKISIDLLDMRNPEALIEPFTVAEIMILFPWLGPKETQRLWVFAADYVEKKNASIWKGQKTC